MKLAVLLLVFATFAGVVAVASADDPRPEWMAGLTAEEWRDLFLDETQAHAADVARLQRTRRENRRLRRVLRQDATIREAIGLASVVYGVSHSMLLRKAVCESKLRRYARNLSSNASGLFQFLPSTWRSTPYARFSVWSPHANALAAGWMHRRGRGNEWVCR